MAKYKIIIRPTAEKELSKHKKNGDPKTNKKITAIFTDLENHPEI